MPMAAYLPSQANKPAEPWLGGGAASGGSELHARVTSAASSLLPQRVSRGSRRAASRGRHGWRLLQLRVITLGRHGHDVLCKLYTVFNVYASQAFQIAHQTENQRHSRQLRLAGS